MRIGLLSDTHGFLDESLFSYFTTCDELWHAGDIGPVSLLHQLQQFRPLVAVYGNTDATDIRAEAPLHAVFERMGLRIWMTHIGASPPRYNSAIRKDMQTHSPHVFVCGHSHILRVERDEQKCLYVNPGAVGHKGHHNERTALRFRIHEQKICDMEAINLGPRGTQAAQA